jgi:hypothetical protein
MPWVESVSPSFRARHDRADADEADRILYSLERTRDRLARLFPRADGDLTAVLHRSLVALSMAQPIVPFAWAMTAPAARRYVAGWAAGDALHVLTGAAREARASNVPGSREMLELTAAALYARHVIGQSNRALPRRLGPRRIRAEVHWAWLLEGTARWFAGQTEHARPAIARRLREGARPGFPPGVRDAALLGGTVVDLLVREEGEEAAAELACTLDRRGAPAALTDAFGGRPFRRTEEAWRSHLERMAGLSGSARTRSR